jgi:pyruvate,water dikinase
LRQRLLRDAHLLYRAGRLQRPEQIFDLTLDNLKYELLNPKSDLSGLADVKREFIDRLSRVRQLPTVIDSRGLIFRPPAPAPTEGEVLGTAVSAGVVRGLVKVLNSPDEKPLKRGEILVARATDPGWTPLFVNAAAVILEIGGALQHGALVAREYGLPCVAGVSGATTLWSDGTMVEVDGSAGIIRRV